MNTENVKLNVTTGADDIGKRIELAGRKISDIQAINFNKYAVDLYKTDGMVMDIENDRELFDSENKINYDVYTMMLEDGKKTLTQPMKCIMEGKGYDTYVHVMPNKKVKEIEKLSVLDSMFSK